MLYKVTWVIELDARSPVDAAQLAHEIMLDSESLATHFTVESEEASIVPVPVDLLNLEEWCSMCGEMTSHRSGAHFNEE